MFFLVFLQSVNFNRILNGCDGKVSEGEYVFLFPIFNLRLNVLKNTPLI